MPEPDLQSFETLAGLAAATDPSRLLPELRHVEGSPGPGGLTLVAAARLSVGHWVGVFKDPDGPLLAAPFAIAGSSLVRALPGDGAATTLARLLVARGELGDDQFSISSFAPVVESAALLGIDERAIDADQTHESVVVGDTAVVKWAVHAEATPAPELVAHLSLAGFTEMPQPWAFVTWADGDQGVLVASVMQFLPGASDGWTWAVLDAGDYAVRDGALAASVEAFGIVGDVVADMHAALATPTAVMPSPTQVAGVVEVDSWRRLASTLFDDAAATVDGDEGDRLTELSGSIHQVFDALGDVTETPVMPVHGDLHIGQVLRWDCGYAVGDFDGNPVLPVAERISPQPAARDVAGMLQSIDHVGRVVLRRVEGADADLVNVWIAGAQARFLGAYRARLSEHRRSHLLDDRLLRPFQVEQECREFLYAVRHLPRWRYVPDQALQALFPQA